MPFVFPVVFTAHCLLFYCSLAAVAASLLRLPEGSETWQSSVLLLFETLPWVQPTKDFFPVPHHKDGNWQLRVIPSYVEIY